VRMQNCIKGASLARLRTSNPVGNRHY
jgi:hypothetical protein